MKGLRIALGVALASIMASPALAQSYPPGEPSGERVLGEVIQRGQPLATTGADLRFWLLVGAGLLVSGVVFVFLGRSRSIRRG